jgi:hypothetical protein
LGSEWLNCYLDSELVEVQPWHQAHERKIMNAFGSIGFVFGMMGFIFGVSAISQASQMKREIEELRKEVEKLKSQKPT